MEFYLMHTMLEVRMELGIFPEDVAKRLAQELPGKGVSVLQPFEEAWGWVIPLQNQPFDAWVGCRCVNFETGLYHISIFPYESMVFLPNFTKVSTEDFVGRVASALEAIFELEPVELVGWYEAAA
ncbi:MAG: hypothetical protein MUC92_07120 [Fimbriimonadaceae bacterium]|nr:hypothetical protein [Fimbriimonadaceae bacterium]